MKRAALILIGGFLIAAVISRALERAGKYQCQCEPDCWCKRPGLNLFRWVVPRWHQLPREID